MSLSTNKIILSGAGTNTAGALFQVQTVAATSSGVVIPAGVYQYAASSSINANVVVQINSTTDGNVSNGTWINVVAVNTSCGLFMSDGITVRALSANAAANITLFTTNGGQAVTGQFNS